MKEYRIDAFFKEGHEKKYFDSREEALIFAGKEVVKGKRVFLLRHIVDGKYDVEKEIK